jgi:hypothetical protein
MSDHEIICPHCKQAFTVDESSYADIVRQVRNDEFQTELHDRLEGAEREKVSAIQLAEAKIAAELAEAARVKDAQIAELNASVESADVAKQLAVSQTIGVKDEEISKLQSRVDEAELRQKLAVIEALGAVEKERDDLARNLEAAETQRQLSEAVLKEQHSKEVALLGETLDTYKDFKARLSTKMLGETLEKHCETSFEQLRATAFQTATFGKDNDARSGSKGDYIFRDRAPAGAEFISIMFEMKNEADATASKKKNEDFLRELDKDRTEKGCEYAVLVSVLEPESDLYNGGIVDVSHLYPKMYVVRPQFFIPIITLLRNAAQATIQVRSELALMREQNVDITDFELRLREMVTGWTSSAQNAEKQFGNAIDGIDKAIADLEKVKEALRLSAKHLNIASGKADKITIRALTRGNATMAAKFAEIEQLADDDAA